MRVQSFRLIGEELDKLLKVDLSLFFQVFPSFLNVVLGKFHSVGLDVPSLEALNAEWR